MSFSLILILLGFTSFVGVNSNAILSRRSDYTYTPGIGAHKIYSRSAIWNNARRICEADNAHLAIINSADEAAAIAGLLNQTNVSEGWIGAHDYFGDDDFVTIHGDTLANAGFDLWRQGEPNGGTSENCVALTKNAALMDQSCASHRIFICEIYSDPTLVSGIIQHIQMRIETGPQFKNLTLQ